MPTGSRTSITSSAPPPRRTSASSGCGRCSPDWAIRTAPAHHPHRRQQGQRFDLGHARRHPAARRLSHRAVHLAASVRAGGTLPGRRPTHLAPELTALLGEIREAIESGKSSSPLSPARPPTFFEMATAIGFLHFVRRRVGCGRAGSGAGRPARFDQRLPAARVRHHQHQPRPHAHLGDRLSSIAREKAGIVKPGRPVVSGATVPEARAVIEGDLPESPGGVAAARRRFPLRLHGGPGNPDGRRPAARSP